MGKVRVKTFDESSPEDEAKLKAKREAKKEKKLAEAKLKKAEVTEEMVQKPEEALEAVPSEEKIEAEENAPSTDGSPVKPEEKLAESVETSEKTEKKNKKTKKEKFVKVKTLGKRHKENLTQVSKAQTYNAEQALSALRKFKKSKFDETVELHINVKDKNTSGQVTLPHGTGKEINIKIADEKLIEEIAKGKINFDVLVASPSMMPNLAKVARILGPKGLMPNPKNGTVSNDPEDAVKKLSAGQINYKTEPVSPIIHTRVGKLSFEDKMLLENIKAFLSSVGNDKISSVTLKSTMSPGIRLNHTNLA